MQPTLPPDSLHQLSRGKSKSAKRYRKHLEILELCRSVARMTAIQFLEAMVAVLTSLGEEAVRGWCLYTVIHIFISPNFNNISITNSMKTQFL